jgi:ABC-type multidrug transport system ATPase subunit
LPEFLTVEESFTLFAKLRGLEERFIKICVDDLIKLFKLNEFSKKLVQNLRLVVFHFYVLIFLKSFLKIYSGGNKRKVNAVIAFIGSPKVVILDGNYFLSFLKLYLINKFIEPTTGVDPASKRYLWAVINKARDLGITIVLTSHSMEECEALCTKIGILVNGQFQCLGNIQHLKNKYGTGYSLVIKTKRDTDQLDVIKRINDFLSIRIKGLKLKGRLFLLKKQTKH